MLSWFGIGGKSKIDILISDQTTFTDELYGESDKINFLEHLWGLLELIIKNR